MKRTVSRVHGAISSVKGWVLVLGWLLKAGFIQGQSETSRSAVETSHVAGSDQVKGEHRIYIYPLALNVWDEDVYEIHTIAQGEEGRASWILFKDGKFDASPEDARKVLEHYDRQNEGKKAKGIFIYSHSYAIPDVQEERDQMTEYLLRIYRDKKWRATENALVDELRQECLRRRIPLYANTSSVLQEPWRVLVSPAR